MAYNDEGHGQQDQSKHPHVPAGNSKGGQFAPKGGGGGSTSKPASKSKPAPKPAAVKRGRSGRSGQAHLRPQPAGPKPRMKRGLNNNPSQVKELQSLMAQLKLSNGAVDGQFGANTEAGVKSVQQRLGLKPTGIASAALVDKLKAARALSPCLGKVAAAAGHDVTPGHDELHHYWTVGEGRHLWADSPTPWTTLVALLTKHVGPEKAKVYASRWFIEVKGYAAGSDMNRVAHGHPPRGDRVGPG